jgi:hypothetical protein
MPLPATNPLYVHAIDKTYDTLWLSSFQVDAEDPNKPIRVLAISEKIVKLEDRSYEKAPQGLDGARDTLVINNLFALAKADRTPFEITTLGGKGPVVILTLADVIAGLLVKVKILVEAQGML